MKLEAETIGEFNYLKLSPTQIINLSQVSEVQRTIHIDTMSRPHNHVSISLSNGKKISHDEDSELGKLLLNYFGFETW